MNQKKESWCSATRLLAAAGVLSRLRATEKIGHFVQRFPVQRVMNPPPITPVADQPRFLQHLQMKGKPGLRGFERAHQIADTALTVGEHPDDLDPRGIRKGVEPGRG